MHVVKASLEAMDQSHRERISGSVEGLVMEDTAISALVERIILQVAFSLLQLIH